MHLVRTWHASGGLCLASDLRHSRSLSAGKYIITHEKVNSDGAAHKNLNVWQGSDGELVAAFHKKGVTNEHWPAIQFDVEEKFLFFCVKDALAVYDMAGDFSKASYKVTLQGMTQFSLSPSNSKIFAGFAPEGRTSKPAVFACNEWSQGGGSVNRKQFFRVRYVVLDVLHHPHGLLTIISTWQNPYLWWLEQSRLHCCISSV